MRIKFSRHHPGDKDEVPSFLRHEIDSGQYERTGFYHDFPVFADNPEVATKLGYLGRTYHTENMEIIHFFNRSKGDMVGSVIFSLDCEGPPGIVHGGAVATALDDILGTMAWRHTGFCRTGIPTVELTVRYRRFTPLGRPIRFETSVKGTQGQKVFLIGRLQDPETGQVLAEADAAFVCLAPKTSSSSRSRQAAVTQMGPLPRVHTRASTPGVPLELPSPKAEVIDEMGVVTGTIGQAGASMESLPGKGGLTGVEGAKGVEQVGGGEEVMQGQEGISAVAMAGTRGSLLPYEEALRYFGAGNPNAERNVLAFYGVQGEGGTHGRSRL